MFLSFQLIMVYVIYQELPLYLLRSGDMLSTSCNIIIQHHTRHSTSHPSFNIPVEMDFYTGNFAAFALLNAVLAFREYRQVYARQENGDGPKAEAEGKRVVLDKFKWNFIPIYLLVNGADWLQVRKSCWFPRGWN